MKEKWLAELWRYRELVYFLAWRDVKIRYKQAVLGAGWAILFWFVLIRGIFWGGGWHRRCAYGGGIDEWHRRAHERMSDGQRVEDDPDRRR